MVVVETLWQLHTLTVINSCYKLLVYAMMESVLIHQIFGTSMYVLLHR